MKYSAWFSIIVGLGILGQWSFFIATGAVPEFQTEPIRIAFHLVAEGATAICLLIAGIGLLSKAKWSRNLAFIGSGMLYYTIIVSPGYFAQLGQWPLVGMFAVLVVLNLINTIRLSRNS